VERYGIRFWSAVSRNILMKPTARRLLREAANDKSSALPVLERSQLAGIITESDIFRPFVEMEGKD
jgi:hypothetical protein